MGNLAIRPEGIFRSGLTESRPKVNVVKEIIRSISIKKIGQFVSNIFRRPKGESGR